MYSSQGVQTLNFILMNINRQCFCPRPYLFVVYLILKNINLNSLYAEFRAQKIHSSTFYYNESLLAKQIFQDL